MHAITKVKEKPLFFFLGQTEIKKEKPLKLVGDGETVFGGRLGSGWPMPPASLKGSALGRSFGNF